MRSKNVYIAVATAALSLIPIAAQANLTCTNGGAQATCSLDSSTSGVYAPSMPTPSAVEFRVTAQAYVARAFGAATADVTLSIDGIACSRASTQKPSYYSTFSVVTDCLVVVPRGQVFTVSAVSGNSQATADGVYISAQPVAVIP